MPVVAIDEANINRAIRYRLRRGDVIGQWVVIRASGFIRRVVQGNISQIDPGSHALLPDQQTHPLIPSSVMLDADHPSNPAGEPDGAPPTAKLEHEPVGPKPASKELGSAGDDPGHPRISNVIDALAYLIE